MTLITRLSTAFTDATLPKLRRDPAISDGTTLLFEPKNTFCYPSQATSVVPAEWATMRNIAQDEYKAITGTDWPTFSKSSLFSSDGQNTLNYDATDNYLYGSSANVYDGPMVGSASHLFPDNTHNYCMSFFVWCDPLTDPNHYNIIQCQNTRFASATASEVSFTLGQFSNSSQVTFSKSNGTSRIAPVLDVSRSAVVQIGMAWQVNNGVWQYKTCVNNVASGWVNDAAGSSANPGIANGSTFACEIKPGADHRIYRMLVEDMTVSTRTPEEVWAADWARGNGRFS